MWQRPRFANSVDTNNTPLQTAMTPKASAGQTRTMKNRATIADTRTPERRVDETREGGISRVYICWPIAVHLKHMSQYPRLEYTINSNPDPVNKATAPLQSLEGLRYSHWHII